MRFWDRVEGRPWQVDLLNKAVIGKILAIEWGHWELFNQILAWKFPFGLAQRVAWRGVQKGVWRVALRAFQSLRHILSCYTYYRWLTFTVHFRGFQRLEGVSSFVPLG